MTNTPLPTQLPSPHVDALRTALWTVVCSDRTTVEHTTRAAIALELLNDVTPAYPPIRTIDNPGTDDGEALWLLAIDRLRVAADAATAIDESGRIAAAADQLIDRR